MEAEFIHYIFVTLLALSIGSFINVVIYRLPIILKQQWTAECQEFLNLPITKPTQNFNLFWPRSHCPKCKKTISMLENIPVLSYIFLMGKCRHCLNKISPRYCFVEIITALLSIAIVANFGLTLTCLLILIFTWCLITLSFIDIENTFLPDGIVFVMLWLGVLGNMLGWLPAGIHNSVIGVCIGYLSLWSIYWLHKLITKREGMGYGDFKLLAMLGAWCGWQMLPLIILASSAVGAVIGISMIVVNKSNKNTPIPFGPYLAIAGWIAIIWGETINYHYLKFAGG